MQSKYEHILLLPVVFWKSVFVFLNTTYFQESAFWHIYHSRSKAKVRQNTTFKLIVRNETIVHLNTTTQTHQKRVVLCPILENCVNTLSYLYLRVRLNMLIYVIILFVRKYAHFCKQYVPNKELICKKLKQISDQLKKTTTLTRCTTLKA